MPACELGRLFRLGGAGLPSRGSPVPTSPAGPGFLPEQTNLTCLRVPERPGTSLCCPFPLLLACLWSPSGSQAQAVVPLASPPPLAMSPFPSPCGVPFFCTGAVGGDVGCPVSPGVVPVATVRAGRGRCTPAGAVASPHLPGAWEKAGVLRGCSLPRPGLPWDGPSTFWAVLNWRSLSNCSGSGLRDLEGVSR